MKSLRIALAAFAVLALAACYPPTTSHPVGTTAGLAPDMALSGTWKTTPKTAKDSMTYFHFLPRKPGSDLTIEAGSDKDTDKSILTATTAVLGANHFMNVRLVSTNGKPEKGAPNSTIPVLYRFDSAHQMLLFMMDEKLVKAAVTAGKIAGTIEKGDYGDVIITADGGTLDRFLTSPAGLALYMSKPAFTLHKTAP